MRQAVLFGHDFALHRGQQGKQAVLREERDARMVHRGLEVLDQRVEIGVAQRQPLMIRPCRGPCRLPARR
jgi:hypothetical protein